MMYYKDTPGAIQTTNATPNTANDCGFIKPGATRTVWLRAVNLQGKMGGATSLSNIGVRFEKWTTTASSAGTAITPSPDDPGYQAAVHTAAFSATTVTSGTGGPTLQLSLGCGVSSYSPWQALADLGDAPSVAAAATQSIDWFNTSPTASQNFEIQLGTAE
jgi:hypothetical protein